MKKQITKVRYDRKKKEVTIEYDLVENGKDDISIKLSSKDQPMDSFGKSLNALAPFVDDICELAEGYCSQAEIRGVSFSWSNGIMGAVITAMVKVSRANSPVVINTPHLPSEDYSGNNPDAPVLTPDCIACLKDVLVQSELYIDGKRMYEQGKMELGEE